MTLVPIIMPDLDLSGQFVLAGNWLVDTGRDVVQGDRLLELVAGDVSVDLPAPASGRLVECAVTEGQQITVGQMLGTILVTSSD